MKIQTDTWKLVTFKDFELIPKTIEILNTRCTETTSLCDTLDKINNTYKCKSRLRTVEKRMTEIRNLYGSLAHLTSSKRTKRGWFDGIGKVMKTIFGTLDSEDAEYYDTAIEQVLKDDHQVYKLMKDQIQVTQSAIQNFNHTVSKLNQNEKTISKNFKILNSFIEDSNKTFSLLETKTKLNTHFNTLDTMSNDLYNNMDLMLNAILFAKQNVLHPFIITPKEVYEELTNNLKSLRQNKEFPLPLNLEDIHVLIDISTLDVFYINFKLVFILNIPLVAPQEYELYHVMPLPVPHSYDKNIYALVQPNKKYIGMMTNKQSYVQFNDIKNCKTLSNEHFICNDLNEYSTISNPSCESQLLTNVIRTLPSDCNSKMLYGNFEIWQKLTNNRWIYIYSKPTKLTVDCLNNNINEFLLKDTGIISLDKGCKGYANLIQITATNNLITNFTAPSIDFDITEDDCCNKDKINKTHNNFMLNPLHLGNIQLDDLNLASVKLNTIEKEIDKEEKALPYSLRPTHYTTITVYILCAIVLMYLLFRFCNITKLCDSLCKRDNNKDNCCIQIFNQCRTRKVNRIEPSVKFTVRAEETESETDIEERVPLKTLRRPSNESIKTTLKYGYNLKN